PLTAGQSVTGVELLADTGLAVSGDVVDEAGQPVPKASVRGFLPPSMTDFRSTLERELRDPVTADENGHFELHGYDEGKVRVRASADGFQTGSVDVAAGATGVRLALERTCEVTGIVVSLTDDEPVPRFRVNLQPRQ